MTKYVVIWRPLPSKGGLGSQLLSKITALSYADKYNYEYLHVRWDNQIHRIGHNYYDDNLFEENIENYFNLGFNKVLYCDVSNNIQKENIIVKNKFNEVTDNPNIFLTEDFIKNLQNNFYANHNRYIKNNNKNIVNIHIRRGDACLIGKYHKNNNYFFHPDHGIINNDNCILSESCIERGDGHEGRIISNEYYINIMNKIIKLYSNVEFNIISQGKIDDFQDINKSFPDFKINFYLDEDILKTFERLYKCDILVLGKSALSYCAGLYCEHIVITNCIVYNWWGDKVPNLPNWITI